KRLKIGFDSVSEVRSKPLTPFEIKRNFGAQIALSRVCNRIVAEREGFEPSIRFPVYTRSRRAPSTTRPPLRDSDAANEHHRAFAMQGSSIRSDRKCQDGIGGFLNRSPLFLCTAFQPGCPRVRSGGETASLLRMLCRCGGAGSGDGDHKDLF